MIFISYSRQDGEFVSRLIQDLEQRGYNVWIDRDDIRGGAAWRASISQAMRDCAAVVAVLSTHSAQSENVARELALADQHRRPIVPISIEPCSIPATMEYQLAGLQTIDFTEASFSESLSNLLQAIESLTPGAASDAQPVEPAAALRSALPATQEPSPELSKKSWLPTNRLLTVAAGFFVVTCLLLIINRSGILGRIKSALLPPSDGMLEPSSKSSSADRKKEYPLILATNSEVRVGVATYRILVAELDSYGANVGGDSFRLLVDGIPLSPTKYPIEAIAAQTAKDFDIEFVISAKANDVVLQLGDVGRENTRIPIDLKATVPGGPARDAPPPPPDTRKYPVTLAADGEARVGEIKYTILTAQLDHYDMDRRTLRLSIRITTSKESRAVSVGGDSFRLLVDGLPLPPQKYPSEVLAAESSRVFDIEFVIPATAGSAILQVGYVRGETSRIPIDLRAMKI